MPMVPGSARPSEARRPLARAAGATATAALLLGTTALAPLSMTAAFADAGPREAADAATAAPRQTLTATDSPSAPGAAGVAVAASQSAATAPEPPRKAPRTALYTLEQFLFSGVVEWGGYRFTFYSQQVLPGAGLQIPGRHVNDDGYVSDADGYIVLAGDAPKGTVFETPFGYRGKIYDRGTFGNHLDVYIE